MKISLYKFFGLALLPAAVLVASCNKDAEDPVPVVAPVSSGASLLESITADSTGPGSLKTFRAAITRASTSSASPSLATLLADRTAQFTVFAPTDGAFLLAFQALGIPPAVGINALRPGQLDTILRYHIVGGRVTGAMIPETFPNAQLPSQFVLQAPSTAVPPGLRMSVFASKRGNNFWVNNVPLVQTDVATANGVVHKPAVVLLPPSQFLWNRIDTDPNLTYLKAAVQRADSGATTATSLVAALSNPAANLTVFAPNDTSFRSAVTEQIRIALIPIITQQLIPVITQQLIASGLTPAQAAAQAPALAAAQAPGLAQTQATALAATPAVFSNPMLYPYLTPTLVRAILAYHVFTSRAFTVNLPTTSTPGYRTFLNTVVATHPGVTLQATFGATGVTAASIRGVANPSASVVIINPTPAPGGTSDQHYVNGVLHVIDQVLRPQ